MILQLKKKEYLGKRGKSIINKWDERLNCHVIGQLSPEEETDSQT